MIGLSTLSRSASPTLRLLVVNQFGINVGFYMLMPYLASYLSVQIGLAAWLVGLILGVRNLGQQGMFLLGGTLADRIGYRPMIIAGCALRTGAFALLALSTSLPALIAAAFATGLAGALFNPAVRAYVAAESADRSADAFALFNIGYQAGILAGPLIGLALTAVDFRLTAAGAATVFAALTIAQWFRLPARHSPGNDHPQGVLAEWRSVVANKPFRQFAAVMAISYVLSFQTYLAIPIALTSALGPAAGITATSITFAATGLLAVLGQAAVQRWCARLPPATVPPLGVAVMAAAFLLPAWFHGGIGSAAAVVGCALLLTVGTLIAYPYEMQTIVQLAGGRLVATHYGLYQTFAGLAIAAGTAATGRAIDFADANSVSELPWAVLAVLGSICAFALLQLSRSQSAAADPPQTI